METSNRASSSVPAAAADAGDAVTGDEVAAGRRGSTTVADRVVAKIAAQAAREALRTGADAATLPRGGRSRPKASVAVRNFSARVRVSVELGYPSDIGSQCGAVRRDVASRVKELAGMDVPDVTVDVERLHSPYTDGKAGGSLR